MKTRAFAFVLVVYLCFAVGCSVSTRFTWDERIEMRRMEILQQKKRLSEVAILKQEIDDLKKRLTENRLRNLRFLQETSGLREKLRRHYPEAETLKY